MEKNFKDYLQNVIGIDEKSFNDLDDKMKVKHMTNFIGHVATKATSQDDIDNAVNKALEDIAEAAGVDKNKGISGIKSLFDDMQEQINTLKEQNKDPQEVVETLEKTVEQEFDKIKEVAELDSGYHKFNVDRKLIDKANVVQSSITGLTDAVRLLDIGQLAHRRLTIMDMLPKITVSGDGNNNATIRYADWVAVAPGATVRAAAGVPEAGTFPESTAQWREYTLELKKIGDTIPVTEESMMDRRRFTDELAFFLETNVGLIIDQQLYSGDGTGNNLTGIRARATAYAEPSGQSIIPDASIYDLAVIVSQTITQGGGSKYAPDMILMNIQDINRMKLKKDGDNNYIQPPFVTMMQDGSMMIGNMRVMESNAVTVNEMVVGDSRYARIYENEMYNISVGYVDGQFAEDLMTLKARKRLNLLIREIDRTGWVLVSNITTALSDLAS